MMKKTMMNLKEWRDELREDRETNPVETFCLLLLLCFIGFVCNRFMSRNPVLLDVTRLDNCRHYHYFVDNL